MSVSYDETLKFVTKLFDGVVDKGGNPYIDHCVAVSNGVSNEDDKIVGLLHDVVEDTEYTCEDLLSMGYDKHIVDAVDAISKRKHEKKEYHKYMNRVKENPIATRVKLSDFSHNMDLSRIENPTDVDFDRVKKYKKGVKFLKGEIDSW